jgi:hypothetical protein
MLRPGGRSQFQLLRQQLKNCDDEPGVIATSCPMLPTTGWF